MKPQIPIETMIAGKYPLYASRFTEAYGSGYLFDGREKLRDETSTLFPDRLSPDNWNYGNLMPSHLNGEKFNGKEFGRQLGNFLEESRKRAFLSMYNSLAGSGKYGLHPILERFVSEDTAKEFGLANFMQRQGNIRGVPIGYPVKDYRAAIGRFISKSHSLHDNQLYILTSQMNTGNDCLAGVAPILFDSQLKGSFPEDTLVLARKYLPVVEMIAENYKRCSNPGAKLWQVTADKLRKEYRLKNVQRKSQK